MMSDVYLRTHAIAGGKSGPHLLIIGGVHGDEFEPMVAIRRLMKLPELASIRGKLTLIPVVNESAFASGHRIGEDGLDLARTCPGRPDGSITEKTAYALSELIRSADALIDLHTGGTTLSVWPLAGYTLHPDSAVLDEQRAMAKAFNLPVTWGTDPTFRGTTLSVALSAKVPAIYAEYLGGARCSAEGVRSYVDGCLNVMALLGMLDRPLPPPRVRFAVEDPRPGSGHMQICNPSPAEGCFESAVELGQPISAGDLLGSVVSPLGRERHDVRSTQTGRVLVLRTFPAVKKGDSLAVILESPAAPSEQSDG